jgi:hypothetical protein
MSDVDTSGFSNVFDEHIRSISKQVIEEEFAKRLICEDSVIVDPEAIKLQRCLQRIMCKEFISAKEAAVLYYSTVQNATFIILSIELDDRSGTTQYHFGRSVKLLPFFALNSSNGLKDDQIII